MSGYPESFLIYDQREVKMSTILPQGEKLKHAVQWISEKRKENPDINLAKLVDDASFRFDLSPKDSEFLLRFVKNDNSQNPS
jgi:hypothetical protein